MGSQWPSRYCLAEQSDGGGWTLLRLDELGRGWPAAATVVEVGLSRADADKRLLDARNAEVLESGYPIDIVDDQLRSAGGDPEEIGKHGSALVANILADRKVRASITNALAELRGPREAQSVLCRAHDLPWTECGECSKAVRRG